MAEDDRPKSLQDQPAQMSQVKYKRHPVYSPSEWLLESISSILALGLLIGIAIIFWSMDNKPLSAWRGRISLNATISILTTACTTALMHGVSAFIAQSKWLHFKNGPRKLADFETFDGASRGVWGSILLLTTIKWNLATIGAFVTILRLAFSPFAQQVVLIEQRDIISPPADTATRCIPQDPGVQSAVFQGLNGINIAEPFNCPGLCRWTGPYISLGFRAECRNVTQETLQSATCEGNPNGLRQCNMTTPGGLGLTTRHVFSDSSTAYILNASSQLPALSEAKLTGPFPETTRFAIYRSTPDVNFYMRDINITDCSLFLTVHEYSGAKANGSDFSFATRRELDFGVKNPWTLGNSPGGNLYAPIYMNATTAGATHVPALQIGFADLLAMGRFFESTMMATQWVEGSFVNTDLGFAAALMGDVDLNERFDALATAMTDYVRYGPNTQLAPGEIIRSEPYISIRWGYFIVPIVTEAVAILFAILSIFGNRRSRQVPLWKSSTLAMLACQYEERLGLLETTARDINEIQDEAGKAVAQLK
ncbi:hypothetical protein FE257_009316 [Aspergillus nanangensis]|uniref:Uncharacterized protein n=1 Tax=Aspergillus nanangensis TaxID=2582783 RepID=A0AAD4CK70_ASPNN|nr:hypothetical protein FE257_009316 [Aspergillus nanangensis]